MWRLARALLFRLDAEEAHELATAQLERIQSLPPLLNALQSLVGSRVPRLPVRLWGLEFPNPLGVAGGFDKNARLAPVLAASGFGFIEVGTVTLHPQTGNPKPRLFRDSDSRALVNRLGFNNEGSESVRRRLEQLWNAGTLGSLPPLLVNIGRNRDVPVESAVDAYGAVYERLAGLADGAVVNVSSPNTPGLRRLQRSEWLRQILETLRERRERIQPLRGGIRPILVKIDPDMDDGQMEETAEVCAALADGMIATNTTTARPAGWKLNESGGLSGAPLMERSTVVLQKLRSLVPSGYPLVGVGGVMDGDDAQRKLDAGASLVQAYTGYVYGGPVWPAAVVRRLAVRGEREAL